MKTLRGGHFKTHPEVYADLPTLADTKQDRRSVYMARYLARWRRLHPGYHKSKNKAWRKANP